MITKVKDEEKALVTKKNKEKYPLAVSEIEKRLALERTPGGYLRASRLRKGMTLSQVAESIGLTFPSAAQYINRIERNIQRLPFDDVKPLCHVLGISDVYVRKLYAEREIKKILEKYGLPTDGLQIALPKIEFSNQQSIISPGKGTNDV